MRFLLRRCASGLAIILRVLQTSLAASRCQLARHMLDTPLTERTGQLTCESEREELRLALISAQESLAVQILLESCMETEEDRVRFYSAVHNYQFVTRKLKLQNYFRRNRDNYWLCKKFEV